MRRLFVLLAVGGCSDGDSLMEPCGRTEDDFVAHCTPFPMDPPAQPITVEWSFYPSVGGPASSTCRAGVANVELHSSDGAFATFPCANRSGRIDVGFGERWLARIVDGSGATIAETPPMGVDGFQQFARFYEDGGFARVNWRVQADGGPLHQKCTEEEPLRMTILSAGTEVSSQVYPCPRSSHMIVSDALREGSYSFVFDGLAGSKTVTIGIGRNNAITDFDVATP